MAGMREVLPIGESPDDPWKKDIDPTAFALSQAFGDIVWADEYLATFEAVRDSDPESAEENLRWLKGSINDAWRHIRRLTELMMAGHAIDYSKEVPEFSMLR